MNTILALIRSNEYAIPLTILWRATAAAITSFRGGKWEFGRVKRKDVSKELFFTFHTSMTQLQKASTSQGHCNEEWETNLLHNLWESYPTLHTNGAEFKARSYVLLSLLLFPITFQSSRTRRNSWATQGQGACYPRSRSAYLQVSVRKKDPLLNDVSASILNVNSAVFTSECFAIHLKKKSK